MRYYVESDGRVFLVPREGLLDLPTKDELPFDVEEIASLAPRAGVLFAVPRLDRHPEAWPSKDDLVASACVTPLVREAIHAGMPRVVVEALCIDRERILLVRGSRGFTKGRWSLPGGFLRFGETPKNGLRRELREELRVEAHVTGEGDVRAKLGAGSRLHWIMIFYRADLRGDPSPDPDEIVEARLVPFDEACGLLFDDVMREVVLQMMQRGREYV